MFELLFDLTWTGLLFCVNIYNTGSKIFLSKGTFLVHDVCQLCSRSSFKFLNVNSFSPNFSKFAVECEIVRFLETFKIWVFWKNRWVSRKKTFFKIAKGGKFAVECVLNGMISQKCLFCPTYEVFWQRIRKLSTLEELEDRMKKEYIFEKKNVFIFLKAFSTKMERRKICRW